MTHGQKLQKCFGPASSSFFYILVPMFMLPLLYLFQRSFSLFLFRSSCHGSSFRVSVKEKRERQDRFYYNTPMVHTVLVRHRLKVIVIELDRKMKRKPRSSRLHTDSIRFCKRLQPGVIKLGLLSERNLILPSFIITNFTYSS